MKKIIGTIFFIFLLIMTFVSNSLAASSYNQVMIKPIQVNQNGIDSFPESYQILLKKLVEKGHTNWKFQAFYTDIDWNELTSKSNENACLRNTIIKSGASTYPDSWYCSCGKEGDTGYYCASDAIVNYYLDPRNFLTEVTIFQFLDLSNTTHISVAQIEKAVDGTYLDGSAGGIRYAQMIYDAAEASGESAYSLITKIFQELGKAGQGDLPEMISGNNEQYPNVYNFFNYGATDGQENQLNGLAYAASMGWNTPYKAMVEGVKLIASSYLNQGQNTKYTFKFDVVGTQKNQLYTHQYMTNVQDANSQAEMLYSTYQANGWLDTDLTFTIPVYKNMPAYVKLPSTQTGNLYYVSSNSTSVYLRTGPGGAESNYTNITALPKDTVVSMLQTGINGWAKVSWNGITGYMSEQYLSPVNTKLDEYTVPISTELPFEDVATDAWYYTCVKYTYEKGMIQGATTTEFRPTKNITRGMIVTILWRMEGEPKLTGGKAFSDVTSGQYYYQAVKWASSKGIVNGYNSGKFGPNDAITREQLAIILSNYAKYKGKNTNKIADTSKYVDWYKVTGNARPAMQWAVATGVITGKYEGTKVDPQGTATRAEAAGMLYNYCTKIK